MAAEPSSSRPKRSPSDTADAPNRKRPLVGDEVSSIDSAEDAITKEEIEGIEPSAGSSSKASKPRNAFSEIMAPKAQSKIKPKGHHTATNSFPGREGLGAYLNNPESFPASRVIFHTPEFVAIHDLYPKATVHCLLLPRSQAKFRLHPFEAFDDAEFLASIRQEAERLKDLVGKELQRLLGKYSAADARRNAVLDGDEEPDRDAEGNVVLPEGRDWSKEVQVGIHARPSMSHLHVHVMSREMHSERVKTRKHYNSFTTGFFVPLEDFPLAEDDSRRHQRGWPARPMVCWRCGNDFGNKFTLLKDHLESEFVKWKTV